MGVFRQNNEIKFTKEDMNGQDKRKILEAFVENDAALSLLLDFISSKHLQKPGTQPGMTAGDNTFNLTAKLPTMQSAHLDAQGMHSPSIYNVQPSHQMSQSAGTQQQLGQGDGSQTVYSTQYQQALQNLQNQASKLSAGVDPQKQAF